MYISGLAGPEQKKILTLPVASLLRLQPLMYRTYEWGGTETSARRLPYGLRAEPLCPIDVHRAASRGGTDIREVGKSRRCQLQGRR